MEFSRYFRLILRKFWIIVLLEVVALAATYYYTDSRPLLYTAKATIILNPSVTNPLVPYVDTSNLYASSLAENYSLIIKSDKFVTKVMQQLDFPISGDELKRSFISRLVPNTIFFNITATYTDPEKATKIANTVTRLFLSEGLSQTQTNSGLDDVIVSTSKKQREQLRNLEQEIEDFNNQIRELRVAEATNEKATEQIRQIRQDLSYRLDVQSRMILAISEGERREINSARNSATLVDDAKPPVQAESNNLFRNLLFAALIAFSLGVGVIILLDFLDYSVRSSSELVQLTGYNTLGIVPIIRPERQIEAPTFAADSSNAENLPDALSTNKLEPIVVTAADFRSSGSEAYRALRTSVLFSTFTDSRVEQELARKFNEPIPSSTEQEAAIKLLLITSSVPAEGKSLTAANLAVAFAQAGSKVILVDADLRKPSLHSLFGLPNEIGLSDLILAGSTELAEFSQSTIVPNLTIITSGTIPPNPSELLTSAKAAAVLETLRAAADLVIFDSPPASIVTDAAILANRTDRVLVVVKWGTTRRDVITKTIANIKEVGGNIIGTILNRAQDTRRSGYYYNRYGYGYGLQHEKKSKTADKV